MGNYPKVMEAFGVKEDIGTAVSDAKSSEDFMLKVGLAPSFGPEDNLKASFKALDDNLKIIILGATNAIRKMPPQKRNWEGVVAEFASTSLLEQEGEEIRKVDDYLASSTSDIKADGANVTKVTSWFNKLINDSDILKSTGIDLEAVAKILAQASKIIADFGVTVGSKASFINTFVEFGVLRYPDISHPYIKLYNIKLTAWSDSSRILWSHEDKCGINGEFLQRIYVPRKAVLDNLSPKVMETATKEAESLLLG